MKILHTADWHLGFQQYMRPVRKRDFYKAAKSVLDIAVENNVKVILFCGDFFNAKKNSYTTLNQGNSIIKLILDCGIKFIPITGNHCDTRDLNWIEYFGLEDSEFINFENINIYKYNWSHSAVEESLRPRLDKDKFNILMLHDGVGGVGSINEQHMDAWKKMGYNYIALGHIHYPYVIDDWIFNPGSTEYTTVNLWGNPGGVFVFNVDKKEKVWYNHIVTPHRECQRFKLDTDILSDDQITAFLIDECSMEKALYHIDVFGSRKVTSRFLSDTEKLIYDTNKPLRIKIVNETGDINISKDRNIEDIDYYTQIFGDMAGKVKKVISSVDNPTEVVDIL